MQRRGAIGTAAVLLLAVGGCNEAATAQAQRAPTATKGAAAPAPAVARLQTVSIVDRLGFDQPRPVGQISIPADWRTEGGVNWDGSTPCAVNQMKFQWRAVAPDGLGAIEFLPGYGWQSPASASPMNPCPVERIGSARDFLMMVAQAMRPGAQTLGYRDRTSDIGAGANGNGYRNEFGELTVRYAVRGKPVEELLTALVSFSGIGGNAGYVVGVRAPAGRLDRGWADKLRASFKGDMGYAQAMGQRGMASVNRFSQAQSAAISSWHNQRMAEINAKGASDRAAIRARGNAETNAIYAGTAASTAATNDGIHDSTVRAIREETTWRNPGTGETVQGSIHGGQRVLDLGNGDYARTDDPYYNPAGSTELNPQ